MESHGRLCWQLPYPPCLSIGLPLHGRSCIDQPYAWEVGTIRVPGELDVWRLYSVWDRPCFPPVHICIKIVSSFVSQQSSDNVKKVHGGMCTDRPHVLFSGAKGAICLHVLKFLHSLIFKPVCVLFFCTDSASVAMCLFDGRAQSNYLEV